MELSYTINHTVQINVLFLRSSQDVLADCGSAARASVLLCRCQNFANFRARLCITNTFPRKCVLLRHKPRRISFWYRLKRVGASRSSSSPGTSVISSSATISTTTLYSHVAETLFANCDARRVLRFPHCRTMERSTPG